MSLEENFLKMTALVRCKFLWRGKTSQLGQYDLPKLICFEAVVPEIRCGPYWLYQNIYSVFQRSSLPLGLSGLKAVVPFPHPFLAEVSMSKYHELFDTSPWGASSRLQEHTEVQSNCANQVLRVKVLISLSHLLAWLKQGLHAPDGKLLI